MIFGFSSHAYSAAWGLPAAATVTVTTALLAPSQGRVPGRRQACNSTEVDTCFMTPPVLSAAHHPYLLSSMNKNDLCLKPILNNS